MRMMCGDKRTALGVAHSQSCMPLLLLLLLPLLLPSHPPSHTPSHHIYMSVRVAKARKQ
jgi:hypothetical protein